MSCERRPLKLPTANQDLELTLEAVARVGAIEEGGLAHALVVQLAALHLAAVVIVVRVVLENTPRHWASVGVRVIGAWLAVVGLGASCRFVVVLTVGRDAFGFLIVLEAGKWSTNSGGCVDFGPLAALVGARVHGVGVAGQAVVLDVTVLVPTPLALLDFVAVNLGHKRVAWRRLALCVAVLIPDKLAGGVVAAVGAVQSLACGLGAFFNFGGLIKRHGASREGAGLHGILATAEPGVYDGRPQKADVMCV